MNAVKKNTFMLYIMNIVNLIFPLLTLPYLTRVLSTPTYGVVAFTKAVTSYMLILMEFGFLLSGTKDIVNAKNDNNKLAYQFSAVTYSKLLISLIAFFIMAILILTMPILRTNWLFAILSFIPAFLTIFTFDFLFRGLEKMEVSTYRFLISKGIATFLTFVFVKGDDSILFIPILDILGTLVAIILIAKYLRKLELKFVPVSFKTIINKLKESFVYFFSEVATTAFSGFNTLIIGIGLSKTDVAFWSLSMQLIMAAQSMFEPIMGAVYPYMLKEKSIKLIKKILYIFTPLLILGCGFSYLVSAPALEIIGGSKYIAAVPIFRILIPIMFFSFYSMFFAWPTLGAINKQATVTFTTIVGAVFQVLVCLILFVFGKFTLITICIARVITEIILATIRGVYLKKNLDYFN